MKYLGSTSLLTLAALIGAPAAAQAVPAPQARPAQQQQQPRPQPQQQQPVQPPAKIEVVSDPVVQALTLPPEPQWPAVMQWGVPQAQALLAAIEGIAAEGLDPRDYRPDALRTAIELGGGPELDALASQSFTWLVEDLRDGRTPMSARKQWFVVDPDADLMPTGKIMEDALQSGDIAGALAALDPTHPDYAALKKMLAATPATDKAKRTMIRANMDRWRWLARDLGAQYLITNVPEYQLRLTVNDKIIRSYRTIVGKPGRNATPQLAEIVEGVIFNPTWTVPQSIVKGEGLGNKVLNNPSWARAQGYKATKGADGYISVVQQPGPTNSLGTIKLDMPNPHAIFLHDTPARNLFNNDQRALSHGCIRVQDAQTMAITIAIVGNMDSREDIPEIQQEVTEIAGSGEYTRVPIKKTMPVYITYFTMGRDIDGKLRSFPDIYDRDAPVLASFNAPRVANRARETDEKVVEIVDDLQT